MVSLISRWFILLLLKVKDNELLFTFEVGQVLISIDQPIAKGPREVYAYLPEDNMKEIEDNFICIKNRIMKYVKGQ